MLYYLLYPLHNIWIGFNVFRYITFRTIYASVTCLVLVLFFGKRYIGWMKQLHVGQVIREDGPKSHYKKAGTPSMGGGLMLVSIAISTILWARLDNFYIWIVLFITIAYGLIGLIDDLRKIRYKNSKGLSAKGKLLLQILVVVIATLAFIHHGHYDTHLSIPFFKRIHPDLHWFYIVLALFVIVGSSNAMNLTDGLDGLAIGPFIITAGVYTIFTYLAGNAVLSSYLQIPYVPGVGELSIFSGALVGAGLGFLWYNAYPAEIFMGDIGSLSLGGALGAVAVLAKQEILLAIAGGVFVAEALSVILQVCYFKCTKGKRIFRMAPLHHHFELKKIPEPKIIVRFWIVSIILGLVALSTLKLR